MHAINRNFAHLSLLVLRSHLFVQKAVNDWIDARVEPRDHTCKHVHARIDIDRLGDEVDYNARKEQDREHYADRQAYPE